MASSILVLEDGENLRETIIELLEDNDYHVVGADGPDKAIELAKQQVFHLMISDIRMAGSTDGIGAVSKIKREIRPEIFVLMITGYADTEAPFRAMDAQVDGYLYKNDFNANLLLMTVESILKQKEEKSFFRSLLNPLVNASKKILQAHEQAKYERAKEKLDEGRYATYKRYVVSIQSRQLLIGGALELWDSFDVIESYYPKFHIPPEMGQLYQKYAEIYKMIDERCRKPLSQLKAREPKQVERKLFQGLFDRICSNRLSATDVQMAEHLRKMDPGERNRDPNFRRLYNRIWLGQI